MRNVKSNRLLVISRLVGASGVFACMLAAIVYLLLQVNGTANSFNPANLYIIAALAVVFVAASLALRAVSNRIALESEDDLDTIEVVEDAVDEELDSCDEVAEAIVEVEDEDEDETEAVEGTVAEVAQPSKLQLTPEKKEKIVKTVKKNAPVILAVVATAAVSVALHNSAKNRQKKKVRQSILDLLY
jgi:low affinity Fe/Cu permease